MDNDKIGDGIPGRNLLKLISRVKKNRHKAYIKEEEEKEDI